MNTYRIKWLLTIVTLAALTIGYVSAQAPNTGTPPSGTRQASPFGDFNVGAIYGQLMDGILTQLAKPETAAKLAKFQKQHFDALVKEGFSQDDALKIVTSTQVPLMPTSK